MTKHMSISEIRALIAQEKPEAATRRIMNLMTQGLVTTRDLPNLLPSLSWPDFFHAREANLRIYQQLVEASRGKPGAVEARRKLANAEDAARWVERVAIAMIENKSQVLD